MLPSKGTRTSWRFGLTGILCGLTGEKEGLVTREEHAHVHAGTAQLKSNLVEKDLGILVGIKLKMKQRSAIVFKIGNSVLGCKVLPASWRR